MEYDAIVIGAGNAGLVAALTLQKKGKKVLVLEQGLNPGGASSSFVRGRFEFDATVQLIGDYGTYENSGSIYQLFQRLGISSKISMRNLNESFHLIVRDTKEAYTFPKGVEDFIAQMDFFVPNSKDSFVTFFGLCEEIRDVLKYLDEHPDIDVNGLYDSYPNFIQLAPHKVKTVLESIHMPKKAIDILSSFWIYLGCPIEEMSFIYFAMVVESFIKYGPSIPLKSSYEIPKTIEEEFKHLGGVIRYHALVEEVLVKNGVVMGVRTAANEVFKTSQIIANISPVVVYGKLIKMENTNVAALKLQNKRELGVKQVNVYLGLNKSMKDLSLSHCVYFILNSLNMDKEKKKMTNVFNKNILACVTESVDQPNTSVITLSTIFYGEEMTKILQEFDYYEFKTQIAKELISAFEDGVGFSITEFIEEIDVSTPVTFSRYTLHPEGTIYGFMAKGYDNFLPRKFCEEKENYIKGLHFCGASGSRLAECKEVLLNGEEVALKVYKECER